MIPSELQKSNENSEYNKNLEVNLDDVNKYNKNLDNVIEIFEFNLETSGITTIKSK